ncbi:MAG: DUF934 domain-containing protein [Burkholderiaceae bacterium]|nr:DUF934 domain-containing protein [Burkholderiaceae bacterium]
MRFIDPAQDPWQALSDDGARAATSLLLTYEQWTTRRADFERTRPLGVLVPNTVDVELLHDDLPRWSLIALQFPKWTDGRAYSQARLLRARLRFGGEVRATGEVLVDMLPLLQRSGFDAVQMRADQSVAAAQRALRFFAGHYQGDVHEARPAFGRPAR